MPTAKRQSERRSPARGAETAPVSPPWKLLAKGNVRVLRAAPFDKIPWLVHGFSTRPGGVSTLVDRPAVAHEKVERVLNLGFTEWDTRENVIENRKRFLRAADASAMTLVSLRQFHSDLIRPFDAAPPEPCRGDASATARPGLLLAVQTADCVPILLADTRRRAVAAVHAGWRGTLRRIVQKTVGRMRMEYGTRPEDLVAALGPAIGGCCYEVGTEVARDFSSQFARAAEWFDELRTGDEPNPLQWMNMMPPGHQPPPKNVLLDLRQANRAQLLDAGLSEKNIFVSGLCTACCSDLLFSYRKEGPQSGRLMAVIGIREDSLRKTKS